MLELTVRLFRKWRPLEGWLLWSMALTTLLSAWTQAGLSVTPVTSSTVTIAVTMLTLPDSQSNNRVQFRIDTQLGVTQVTVSYTHLTLPTSDLV